MSMALLKRCGVTGTGSVCSLAFLASAATVLRGSKREIIQTLLRRYEEFGPGKYKIEIRL
jgi:hypothetical protein